MSYNSARIELLTEARKAIDEQRYERAQALSAFVMALAAIQTGDALADIAASLKDADDPAASIAGTLADIARNTGPGN